MNNTISQYNTVTAFIEIPASSQVKYEVDNNGSIIVDRFLETAMHYPCNYGYIPNTRAGDGDELDILVLTPFPLHPGVKINCRPLGILSMIDEKGEDDKIIAVPADKISTHYRAIQSMPDLEKMLPTFLKRLRHFFERYKDLDEGKWVQVQSGWGNPESAMQLIAKANQQYKKQS